MTGPDQPPAQLVELSDARREQAMSRWALLRPHIEDGVALTALARQAGVPLRTTQRWLAQYRATHIPAAVHQSHRSHSMPSAHQPHRAHQPSTPSYGWGNQGWGLYQNGAPVGGFSPRSTTHPPHSRARTRADPAHRSDGGLLPLVLIALVMWGIYQSVHGAHMHHETVTEYVSHLIHRWMA